MKKLLTLSLLFTGAVALANPTAIRPNGARMIESNPSIESISAPAMMTSPLTRADEELSMEWGYCGEPYTALQLGMKSIKQAIKITADMTNEFAGNDITAILMSNPVKVSNTGSYLNPVKKATVWLTYDLDGEPFATGTANLTKNGFEWSTIELEEPFTLKAGDEFYAGVTYLVPTAGTQGVYDIVADYNYPLYDYTNYLYTDITGIDQEKGVPIHGETTEWRQFGTIMGNAMIRLQLVGETLPVDRAVVTDATVPVLTTPGEAFPASVMIRNMAANAIESADLTIEIPGKETVVREITVCNGIDQNTGEYLYGPIKYGEYGLLTTDLVINNPGNEAYRFSVSKINGMNPNNSDSSMATSTLCITEGFPRNVVIEEATGTWCGWCVRGYVGMEYMAENYRDKGFIGIAAHYEDPMAVIANGEGYAYNGDLYYNFAGNGFPSAIANRVFIDVLDPDASKLEAAYNYWKNVPATTSISADLEVVETSDNEPAALTLNTTTKFYYDNNADMYSIGYVVVEDGVGPYSQTNYYAGGGYGEMGGFESKPQNTLLKFNDVARNCSKPAGIENSVPATVYADENYTNSFHIDLTDVKKPQNVRVVALVVNNYNGFIENACEVTTPLAGVKTLSAESAQSLIAYGSKGAINFRTTGIDCAVYTIDGREVARNIKGGNIEVPAGLYIVTNGRQSQKVTVK